MKIIYTTEEVLANLQDILEAVRAGERITVTEHDVPVAEIRPLPEERRQPYADSTDKLEQHLEELRRRGVLQPAKDSGQTIKPGPHVPGAMERFLKERG